MGSYTGGCICGAVKNFTKARWFFVFILCGLTFFASFKLVLHQWHRSKCKNIKWEHMKENLILPNLKTGFYTWVYTRVGLQNGWKKMPERGLGLFTDKPTWRWAVEICSVVSNQSKNIWTSILIFLLVQFSGRTVKIFI